MAPFKLLAPHSFKTSRGEAYYETGAVVSDSEVIGFKATAWMQALDDAAQALLKAECDRLRQETVSNNTPGTVIGYGATSTLPA